MTIVRRRASVGAALLVAICSVLDCSVGDGRAKASGIAANVEPPGCNVAIASPAFPRYDALDDAPTKGQGGIDVTCTSARTDGIAVAASGGSSLDPSRRFMRGRSGAGTLRYALYLDSRADRIWGDGTRGTALVRLAVVPGVRSASQPIFGIIAPRQNVSPGSYRDDLTITVVF